MPNFYNTEIARRLQLCVLALMTITVSRPLWAQSGTDLQFQAYHAALSSAADDLLSTQAVSKQEVEMAPETPADLSFIHATGRVREIRPLMKQILVDEGLPVDLAAVVLIESGGRTMALSPKGALGLWQLMPDTARRYGLTVSSAKDERTDIVKATRAAARYLRDLHAQFGDWQLALAAYNAGESAVAKAVARANSREFGRLSRFLPNETRAYVPAVMSARPLFGTDHVVDQGKIRRVTQAQVLYARARLEQ